MASKKALMIDGSVMEGGGQVLRVAFGLAAILGKHIVVHNIRGGRSKPGLKAQHVQGILLATRIVGGRVIGADINSTTVEFIPNEQEEDKEDFLKTHKYTADTKTAGAITLLAQIAFPVALFKGSKTTMELKGGTNTHMAPQIEYYEHVFMPTFARLFRSLPQSSISLEVVRRGFFPRGGGHVRLTVDSTSLINRSLDAFDLVETPSRVANVDVYVTANTERRALSFAEDAERSLRAQGGATIAPSTCIKSVHGVGSGSSLVLVARTNNECLIGSDALASSKDETCKTMCSKATDLLINNVVAQGCVDEFMQDQLIIFMALAKGKSRLMCGSRPLTLHTRTAIHICELMTGARFSFDQEQIDDNDHNRKGVVVHCEGIGLKVGMIKPSHS